jgi:predicted DNA binding CopG/RHH family protein
MDMNKNELKDYKREYNKNEYKTVKVYIKKEEYERISEQAAKKEMPMSGYIKSLIDADMKTIGGGNTCKEKAKRTRSKEEEKR